MTAGRRTRWRERARPRRVITATGLAGTGLLAASMSVRPGSRQFYLLTAGLACTWAGGARAAGPLPWAGIPEHGSMPRRLVVMPVLTGAGAFGLFYGAARLARHIPVLNQAVAAALRYAEEGPAPLVLLSASANAVAEELFFHGALWSLTEERHPLATTTIAYTATTAATRNPALTMAGTATSVLFGLHRRASGGVLAPIITHLTWSVLMLHYLPPLFETSPAVPGRCWRSISSPNQIIAVLTAKMATTAARSRMPTNSPISTIITDALTEYSIHRA